METKYEFGTARNGYFDGHDGMIVRKSDRETVRIRFSERGTLLAVNVKDYETYWGASVPEGFSDETVVKLRDLTNTHGEEYMGGLYEMAREQWWSDAEWLTEEDGDRPDWADGVYQEGRSGGWCVIKGTEPLADDFRTDNYHPGEGKLFIVGITLDPETDRPRRLAEFDTEDEASAYIETLDGYEDGRYYIDYMGDMIALQKMREEFCDLAFIMVDMIVGMRQGYMTERINDDHAELTERREAVLIRGYN